MIKSSPDRRFKPGLSFQETNRYMASRMARVLSLTFSLVAIITLATLIQAR